MTETVSFRNGHHISKGSGTPVVRGRLPFFRASIESLPLPQPIRSAEEAAEGMYTDGLVQFPDLLSSQQVAEVRKWMENSGGPDEQYEVKGWCFNKHVTMDAQHDPMWLNLIDRSPAFEVMELILGRGFILAGGSIWVTGKGRDMSLHVDHQTFSFPEEILRDERVRVPIYQCTLHVYLNDQVENIGPTLVVPGSHRAGRAPQNESTWNGIAPKMVSVKAGGAVLFRHDLWHGASMNRSKDRRYLLQIHYAESNRQMTSPPITQPECYSPEVLALATERQRVLLGAAQPACTY
jgi:hypothetical protein